MDVLEDLRGKKLVIEMKLVPESVRETIEKAKKEDHDLVKKIHESLKEAEEKIEKKIIGW